MLLRWWWLTLLFVALGLVMGGAHVLQLPVRLRYEPELYMQVTSTLYLFFGLVGGPVQIFALLATIVLSWLVRHRVAFHYTLAGTLSLALSLLLWFLLVEPVNVAWAQALGEGSSEAIQAYSQLRNRWEIGHAAAFAAWLLGFTLLLRGALREMDL